MYAPDEAWNARDWETFDAYHDQDDVVVYWPGREQTPTLGALIGSHALESGNTLTRNAVVRGIRHLEGV